MGYNLVMKECCPTWRQTLIRTMGFSAVWVPACGFDNCFRLSCVLGDSWDLVTTYDWAYNPTSNWGNLYKPSYEGLSAGLEVQLK